MANKFDKIETLEDLFLRCEENEDGCWLYKGHKDVSGYGRCRFSGRVQPTHRIALKLSGKEIPDGKYALHHCDKPPCCNPDHLCIGDQRDNMRDMSDRGRAGTVRGERHGMSKLTGDEVKEIRERYNSGEKPIKIAEDYSVSFSQMCSICRGKFWSSV